MRSTHRERHEFSVKPSVNHTRGSLETDFRKRAGNLIKKACETPSAVAAHIRLTTVAVEISHPKVSLAHGLLGKEDPVGANASMTIAQKSYLLGLKFISAVPIIDEDEIVAGAVHFRKSKHTGSLTYNERKRKLQLLLF